MHRLRSCFKIQQNHIQWNKMCLLYWKEQELCAFQSFMFRIQRWKFWTICSVTLTLPVTEETSSGFFSYSPDLTIGGMKIKDFVRFQVLTARRMKMTILYDVAPYSLVDTDQRFREAYRLRHHGDEQQVPLKRRSISTRLHGATSQKTAIFNKRYCQIPMTLALSLHCCTVLYLIQFCKWRGKTAIILSECYAL
jgi:hypothetical protein